MPCGFTAAQSIIARLFLTIMRACVSRGLCAHTHGQHDLTSDDVFDYMLDLRALNDGVDMRREQMFADYNDLRRKSFRCTA